MAAVQQLISHLTEMRSIHTGGVHGLHLFCVLPKLLRPNEERNAHLKERVAQCQERLQLVNRHDRKTLRRRALLTQGMRLTYTSTTG
eukprot:1130089-Amphidinium_carterae.1